MKLTPHLSLLLINGTEKAVICKLKEIRFVLRRDEIPFDTMVVREITQKFEGIFLSKVRV